MPTSVLDNFAYKGANYLDSRQLVDALTALRNWDFVNVPIPDGFKVFCAADKNWYIYKSSNSVDQSTGFFRKEDNDLEAAVTELQQTLDATISDVATLQSDMATAKSNINILLAAKDDHTARLVELESWREFETNQTNSLETSYEDHETRIQQLEQVDAKNYGLYTDLNALKAADPVPTTGDWGTVWNDVNNTMIVYRYTGTAWVNAGSWSPSSISRLSDFETKQLIGLVNVDAVTPPGAAYHTFATAVAAVPTLYRKMGLVICYREAANKIVMKQFFRGDPSVASNWTSLSNWCTYPQSSVHAHEI